MTWNLREHIATDGLRTSIGGAFGMSVNLIYPDGTRQDDLVAQVLYDRLALDPETGDEVVTQETKISLVKVDLDQEISAGDKIFIEYPANPADQATLTSALMDGDKAPVDGGSIGFISIFPKQVEQL